jgi:toxin-antitoxin system PIN domain toxin
MTDAERVFVDTNVLLAASDPSRPHHRKALHVLDRWPSTGVILFASGQVLREYLVVATRPLQANGLGLSRAEALDNVQQLLRRLHLLDESARSRERLLALVRDVEVSGKQIHDANIVATMLGGEVTAILTLDRGDFERFGHMVTLMELPEVGGGG